MASVSDFGGNGESKQRTTAGSDGREGRDSNVSVPDQSVVEWILEAVQAGDGLVEFPLHREDAVNVSELAEDTENDRVQELLDELPDSVETLSFEDFFGLDLEADGYEYIGTEPKLNETDKNEFTNLSDEKKEVYQDEDIYKHGKPDKGKKAYMTAPDWVEIVRNNDIDGESVYRASTVLNGHFYPLIYEYLSEDEKAGLARLSVGVGKSYNNEDEFAKRKSVSFSIQEGKSTAKRVFNALEQEVGLDSEVRGDWNDGQIDSDDVVDVVKETTSEESEDEE